MCENEDFCTPSEVLEMANTATLSLLPEKSRKQYEIAYNRYKEWCVDKGVVHVTENVLLAYFSERSTKVKPSSLWSEYSMVRASLSVKDDVNIKKYTKLLAFMKRNSVGFRSKKSKTLNREQIYKFLKEASDIQYLMKKVVAIFGVAGACRRDELQKMSVDDIEKVGSILLVKIPRSKTDKERSFVVKGEVDEELNLIDIYQKYADLRPAHTVHKRFFINYRNGKCSVQAVGVNTFAKVPSEIAKYLCLENSELYTGHCFRRSSATLLADTGADILSLKRHGGWKSSTVAEGYVEESIGNKISTAEQIFQKELVVDTEQEYVQEGTASNEEDSKKSPLRPFNIKNCNNCTFTFNINT